MKIPMITNKLSIKMIVWNELIVSTNTKLTFILIWNKYIDRYNTLYKAFKNDNNKNKNKKIKK